MQNVRLRPAPVYPKKIIILASFHVVFFVCAWTTSDRFSHLAKCKSNRTSGWSNNAWNDKHTWAQWLWRRPISDMWKSIGDQGSLPFNGPTKQAWPICQTMECFCRFPSWLMRWQANLPDGHTFGCQVLVPFLKWWRRRGRNNTKKNFNFKK